jgi:hypothetical protein
MEEKRRKERNMKMRKLKLPFSKGPYTRRELAYIPTRGPGFRRGKFKGIKCSKFKALKHPSIY